MDKVTDAETTGVANVEELLANLLPAFALGIFVTFALLVGEFVFEQILAPKTMVMTCVLSDLLFGPVTVIAFFHRDSFSTMLFMAIVWHFLCDLEIKPSNIFVVPSQNLTTSERIHWIQCFWKMLHHLATAVIKFATDMGKLDTGEKFGDRGNVALIFFFYLTGTSLIHLSTSLHHFGAKKTSTAMLTLALSLKLGMGFCMWYIFWPTQSPWRYLGLTDNVWTTVYISLFVIQGFVRQPAQPDLPESPNRIDALVQKVSSRQKDGNHGAFMLKSSSINAFRALATQKSDVSWQPDLQTDSSSPNILQTDSSKRILTNIRTITEKTEASTLGIATV